MFTIICRLYRITKRAGEREGSGLMKANAWHHRADAVSSLVALIGVGKNFDFSCQRSLWKRLTKIQLGDSVFADINVWISGIQLV